MEKYSSAALSHHSVITIKCLERFTITYIPEWLGDWICDSRIAESPWGEIHSTRSAYQLSPGVPSAGIPVAFRWDAGGCVWCRRSRRSKSGVCWGCVAAFRGRNHFAPSAPRSCDLRTECRGKCRSRQDARLPDHLSHPQIFDESPRWGSVRLGVLLLPEYHKSSDED